MSMCRKSFLLLIGVLLLTQASPRLAAEDVYQSQVPTMESLVVDDSATSAQMPSSANPVLRQQYQALQTGVVPGSSSVSCGKCGGQYPYDRCGCNEELFPWIGGPGNCDQWCVGPKWEVQAGGLMLFRDDAELASVIGFIGGTTSLVDQFDHGIGGRLFVTGYNDSGFGLQIGWEGVNQWTANATFDPVGSETRTVALSSRLNSVEINFLPNVPYMWKVFSGFRYVELVDDLVDSRINDKPIPAPADPPAANSFVTDTTVSHLLKNQLIGFQLGARRDAWHWGERLTIASFANAGVYCNKFRRDDVTRTDTTIITGDDLSTTDNEFSQTTTSVSNRVRTSPTDVAFLGEAGITGTWKINECVALHSGYQIMALDGVGQALDAFFTSGLNADTVVYHGLQFGFEYRR